MSIIKVYKHYQQGFLTNEQLHDIYKDILKDEIENFHRIYCRNFFQGHEDYYKFVKDKLINLINKYNDLYN